MSMCRVMGLDPTWLQIQDTLRDFCTSPERRPEDYVTVYLAGQAEWSRGPGKR